LLIPDTEDDLPFILDTIRLLRRELVHRVPLIGFAGAPFTLATYMIEGGTSKNFVNTKRMMFQNGPVFRYLMEKITDMLISYLSSQIRAGAQAVQIFDSWAGILAPGDYKKYAFPYAKKVISETRKEQVPVIYFVNDCAGILKEVKNCGADVISVDWRVDLSDAIKKLGRKVTIQGNLDPCALFLPREKLEERVKEILWKGEAAKSHIFNLGHGILPQTPVENVIAMVESVHTYGSRK
jgi:uroporphyrinogen decarboxylase